jgi:competence protein ComEA
VRAVKRAAGVRERALEAVRFHPREALALCALGVLIVCGAVLAYVRGRPASAAPLAPVATASADASPSPDGALVVHVVGDVNRPGVYTFASGARVLDAVRAAGGFGRDADTQAINLARPLVDGEQIVVPRKGAPAPDAAGSAARSGTVNINTAGVAEFDGLPGIGPVLAQRIVDYRTRHGPFRTVEDLMKVPGIGPKKFDALKGLISV